MHKTGNGNFVFPNIYNFLLLFYYILLVNVELDHYISRLQTSLILLISNDSAKTKLAILAFLYCEEFMKTAIDAKQAKIHKSSTPLVCHYNDQAASLHSL